jgi:hypothetical protein
MKRTISYLTIAILPAIIVYSCQDQYNICDLPKSVNFRGVFYKKIGAADVESQVPSLTLQPLNTTTYIYNQQPNVSSFAFALNPVVTTAKYVLKINSTAQQDTLTLNYTSQTVSLSAECGIITTHDILSAYCTNNAIDSAKLNFSKVDNNNNINLKLYFH